MSHRNARLTPHGRLLLCGASNAGWQVARPPRPPASAARRRASGSPAGAPRARPAFSTVPRAAAASPCAWSASLLRRVVAAAPAPARRPGLDRLAHGPRPGDRLPRPEAPPPASPARARAARAGGALLLAACRRPRPPRHEEAGAHRRRRRQALAADRQGPLQRHRLGLRARGRRRRHAAGLRRGARRRARRERGRLPGARLAFFAGHGIEVRRLLTDNGSCYCSKRLPRRGRGTGPATGARGPTGRRPTARRRRS